MRASVHTSKNSTSPAELVPACTTKDCFLICREPSGFKSTELCLRVSQLSYNGLNLNSLLQLSHYN